MPSAASSEVSFVLPTDVAARLHPEFGDWRQQPYHAPSLNGSAVTAPQSSEGGQEASSAASDTQSLSDESDGGKISLVNPIINEVIARAENLGLEPDDEHVKAFYDRASAFGDLWPTKVVNLAKAYAAGIPKDRLQAEYSWIVPVCLHRALTDLSLSGGIDPVAKVPLTEVQWQEKMNSILDVDRWVVPPAVRSQIRDDVERSWSEWDWELSLELAKRDCTFIIRPEHVRAAIFLDALYKRHFGGKFDRDLIDRLPGDAEMTSLFALACHDLDTAVCEPNRLGELAPRARETFRMLYDDFDSLAPFSRIHPSHRFRLIPDRQHIEVLRKGKIDINNPLLAFLYESDKSYAHSSANGCKAMALALAERCPFDRTLIQRFADALGIKPFPTLSSMRYGVMHTRKGIESTAEVAELLDGFGIGYGITLCGKNGKTLLLSDGQVSTAPPDPSFHNALRDHTNLDGISFREAVKSACEAEITLCYIHRDNCATEQPLNDAIDEIVRRYEAMPKTTEDEKIKAAAFVYLSCERIHPGSDGNYRLFGKLSLWYLLLIRGLEMTDFYDPNTSDGLAPDEAIVPVENGQLWIRDLSVEGYPWDSDSESEPGDDSRTTGTEASDSGSDQEE